MDHTHGKHPSTLTGMQWSELSSQDPFHPPGSLRSPYAIDKVGYSPTHNTIPYNAVCYKICLRWQDFVAKTVWQKHWSLFDVVRWKALKTKRGLSSAFKNILNTNAVRKDSKTQHNRQAVAQKNQSHTFQTQLYSILESITKWPVSATSTKKLYSLSSLSLHTKGPTHISNL